MDQLHQALACKDVFLVHIMLYIYNDGFMKQEFREELVPRI